MQVRPVRVGISGDPHVTQQLAAPELALFGDAVGIALQVRVVIRHRAVAIELVNRQAALFAGEQFFNAAIGNRQYWRAVGRHDVDGIVRAAFAA